MQICDPICAPPANFATSPQPPARRRAIVANGIVKHDRPPSSAARTRAALPGPPARRPASRLRATTLRKPKTREARAATRRAAPLEEQKRERAAVPAKPKKTSTVSVAAARLPAVAPPAENALLLRGEYWEVRYNGASALLDDCRGLAYLATLIQQAASGKGPIHAKELATLGTNGATAVVELETADPVLDRVARRQFMERLEEIAAERDRACAAGDLDRAASLDAEHEQIADQLSRTVRSAAFDHGGEKARKAVGKALSEAIARIAGCPGLAPLGDHFAGAVRKGQWLSYDGSARWDIEFRRPLRAK